MYINLTSRLALSNKVAIYVLLAMLEYTFSRKINPASVSVIDVVAKINILHLESKRRTLGARALSQWRLNWHGRTRVLAAGRELFSP
jgi:hypothetical protein